MAGFSKIAVVVKGYPRLSETFIAQEIRGLEKRGLELNLFSLRHPTDPHIHPIHREIRSPVTYLPEYLHQHPLRIAKAATSAKSLPGFRRALEVFQKDFSRDRTRNRIRRFGQACVLAIEMNAATDCLYAHFLHTPASVARYAAIMRDLPLHLSGHAVDIWTSPDWELTEKMKDARWTSVCSEAGAQRLRALSETPENVIRLYHGLDLNRFPPITHEKPHRSGNQKSDPVHLLSVGRAVPKKGFPVMLDALALLPESLNWRWEHIGDGDQIYRTRSIGGAPSPNNTCWKACAKRIFSPCPACPTKMAIKTACRMYCWRLRANDCPSSRRILPPSRNSSAMGKPACWSHPVMPIRFKKRSFA